MKAAQIVLLPLREKVAGEARRMRGVRPLGREPLFGRLGAVTFATPHPTPLRGATFSHEGRRELCVA